MLERYAFLIQSVIWMAPIIGSYFAYRQERAPQKQESARQDLIRLGLTDTTGDLQKALEREYTARDYFWPLFYASALTVIVYSMTHPTVIQTGLWYGVLEERIGVFSNDPSSIEHTFLVGRALFWGWLGAYIYAFNIIFRRFMSYDLTPSVYMFVATRMALAFTFGGIVIIGFGLTPDIMTGGSYNNLLTSIAVAAFFVGFFPERGLDWISATWKRITGDGNALANETRLSRLEGLSVWHQGRLKQQDIENVQNLASADIPLLIVATPFGVAQIIDWIDQAILLLYANDDAYPLLDNSGLRCASDFLTATETEESILMLSESSGISVTRLRMLRLSVESSSNIQVTSYYRWHASTDPNRVRKAENMLELRPNRRIRMLETQELNALEELEKARQRQSKIAPSLTTGTNPSV